MKWDLQKVVDRYNSAYPTRPHLLYSNEWIVGSFCIGNDYRNRREYYGAYPGDLLQRYDAMFGLPDKHINVLHIFSGAIPEGPYTRVDLLQPAEYNIDCEELHKHIKYNSFDIIFADPPYTKDDADKYGTDMPNRLAVMRSASKIARPGALMVWLDLFKPMYRKTEWKQVGTIGLERSTNHRIRGIWLFERQERSKDSEDYF